ncbi:MAG: hypothetical protein VX951_10220, partial [Planctomycetota bacterium]|nr:hypothetical protein [Planctomycetota bacterium]
KQRLRKSANVTHAREVDVCAVLEGMANGDFSPFFVPYDEAHLSRRGHAVTADALWARFAQEKVLAR